MYMIEAGRSGRVAPAVASVSRGMQKDVDS
jgi:hypothetical protein